MNKEIKPEQTAQARRAKSERVLAEPLFREGE